MSKTCNTHLINVDRVEVLDFSTMLIFRKEVEMSKDLSMTFYTYLNMGHFKA